MFNPPLSLLAEIRDSVNSFGSLDYISHLYQWSMAMRVYCVLSCLTHRNTSGIAGHRVWNDAATTGPNIVITVHLGIHINNRDPLDVAWRCVCDLATTPQVAALPAAAT